MLNEHEKAISAYEQARKLGIRPEKCTVALGKLCNKSAISSLQQRKYGEAVIRFEQALGGPNSAKTLYALGLSHNGNRNEKRAQNAFERAVKADPQCQSILSDSGHTAPSPRVRSRIDLQKAIDADAKYMAMQAMPHQIRYAGR